MELSAEKLYPPNTTIVIYKLTEFTGLQNMAIDYYLSQLPQKRNYITFRLYKWRPFCISIGFHQDIHELNIEKIKSNDLDIIRRPTGGRAIYHSEELTYSVICPVNLMSHHELYYNTHLILSYALNNMGFDVNLSDKPGLSTELSPRNRAYPCFVNSAESELQFQDKKIAGSAQKIYKNSVLQHGSILIGTKHKEIVNYLRLKNKSMALLRNKLENKTVCLNEICNRNINAGEIEDQIINVLGKIDNISLIYQEFNRDLLENSEKIYLENIYN